MDGAEWQSYSLMLAQARHGAANVQQVPDKVRGDCGIEFSRSTAACTSATRAEEVSDIAKAASAMKAKAQRDLSKLEKIQGADRRDSSVCAGAALDTALPLS